MLILLCLHLIRCQRIGKADICEKTKARFFKNSFKAGFACVLTSYRAREAHLTGKVK